MKLVVQIPCLNEAETLPLVLSSIPKSIKGIKEIVVLVIDDGSTDDTVAKVRRERIGFIFQSFHLIPRLTAAENIELPLILEGIPAAQRKQRVQTALQQTGLLDRAHHRPAELSGGQRQRVAIARATILNPAVLLADEPTGNLDHKTGAEVVALLESLNQTGTTVIVVTHDRELGGRAQRKIQMRDGEVVEDEQG